MSVKITWEQFKKSIGRLAERNRTRDTSGLVYGVPTGGSFVAILLEQYGFSQIDKLDNESPARVLVVDDLVDSGNTLQPYKDRGYSVDAIFRKPHSPQDLASDAELVEGWLEFPWEHASAPEDAVIRLIEYIGENPTREGLRDTPNRVLRALKEMCGGYKTDISKLVSKQFTSDVDEMVVETGIVFTSLCEHHMLPFTGICDVGYIPNGRVYGASKIARVVDCFARRLQIQERMTSQIARALHEGLSGCQGVGVIARASHACMACRGVLQRNAKLVTSCLLGVFRDIAVRTEFLRLIERSHYE